MKYSTKQEMMHISSDSNLSSTSTIDKSLKSTMNTSIQEESKIQYLIEGKYSSIKSFNKISNTIENKFDLKSVETLGSTMIIADDFYVTTEQNKTHLNKEDEKSISSIYYIYK